MVSSQILSDLRHTILYGTAWGERKADGVGDIDFMSPIRPLTPILV